MRKLDSGVFDPTKPYDLTLLHDVWQRWVSPALNHATNTGTLRRLIRGGDTNYLVEIRLDRQFKLLAQQSISKTVSTPEPVQEDLHHIITRWLGADIDTSAFYAYCAEDKFLSSLVHPLIGIPLWRTTDMFEALIFPIIEQHINWQAAQRAQTVLVQHFGETITIEDHTYHAMPIASTIASLTIEDLHPLKITYKRMQLILDLARSIANGTLQLEHYWQAYQRATHSDRLHIANELYKYLMAIKGIGHWTATNVVSRSLGIYPYVLHNDVALQAAVGFYFYGQDGRVDVPTLKQTFAPYGDYAGLVAHFTLLRWVLDRYPSQQSS